MATYGEMPKGNKSMKNAGVAKGGKNTSPEATNKMGSMAGSTKSDPMMEDMPCNPMKKRSKSGY